MLHNLAMRTSNLQALGREARRSVRVRRMSRISTTTAIRARIVRLSGRDIARGGGSGVNSARVVVGMEVRG